jgi:hypothetical protein
LFRSEIFPRQIPRHVKLILFIGAGLKSSLNLLPAGDLETVSPGQARLAATLKVNNIQTPFAQAVKRILFNASVVFILTFSSS